MSEIRPGSLLDIMAGMNYGGGKNYPIPLGDIALLPNEEWLHWRDHGPVWRNPLSPDYIDYTVGGSDTAAIIGISPWTTSLQLFGKKTGVATAVKNPGNEAAFKAGHRFEPYVAEVALDKLRAESWIDTVEMYDDTTMYRCGQRNPDGSLKYPWALADFDRIAVINGEPYIVELKTTSYRNYEVIKEWTSGICPRYYETQVRHYMAVANIDHAVICCSWGFKEDEAALVFIDRDLDFEEELMAAEEEFVICCREGFEPELEAQNKALLMKYYAELYGLPVTPEAPVELSSSYKDPVMRLIKAEEKVKKQEKILEAAKQEYDAACGELLPAFVTDTGDKVCSFAYLNDTDSGQHIGITLSASKGRVKIDQEKLRAEHPLEYAACQETKFSMALLRALDRREKTHFATEYKLPDEPSADPKLSLKVKVSPLA